MQFITSQINKREHVINGVWSSVLDVLSNARRWHFSSLYCKLYSFRHAVSKKYSSSRLLYTAGDSCTMEEMFTHLFHTVFFGLLKVHSECISVDVCTFLTSWSMRLIQVINCHVCSCPAEVSSCEYELSLTLMSMNVFNILISQLIRPHILTSDMQH